MKEEARGFFEAEESMLFGFVQSLLVSLQMGRGLDGGNVWRAVREMTSALTVSQKYV